MNRITSKHDIVDEDGIKRRYLFFFGRRWAPYFAKGTKEFDECETIIATLSKYEDRMGAKSRPTPGDEENSLRCGHCTNDVLMDDGYRFCPYCGGNL